MISALKTLLKIAKNNPILVSLMPVVLCSLAYLYQVFVLKKWEIPLGMIDGMRIQYLMIVVVGLFYCFSASYLQEYMRLKFDRYAPSYMAHTFLRKNLKKAAESKNGDKYEIAQVKQICNRLRFSVAKSIILVALLGSLCFLPFCVLFFVIVFNARISSVFLSYALTVVTTVFFAYRFNCRQMRKEIREIKIRIKKEGKTPKAHLSACDKISKIESARLNKMPNNEDANMAALSHLAAPLAAIIMFFLCMVFNLCSPPQKDYWIYTNDNGDSFASVFELGDSFILKRATINNDEIIIFLDDQMSIEITGVSMKHSLFEKVTIERDNHF